MIIKALTILVLSCFSIAVMAHSGEDHKKKEKTPVSIEEKKMEQEKVKSSDGHAHDHGSHEHKKELTADFDDFPTLHPLVVHFPIVLLLIAAISQFISLFVFKEALSWTALGLVVFGFIGAYVAGNNVHPHTTGLTDFAEKLLTEHERYSNYTVWLSGIAVVLKIVSHFFLKRNIWSEIVVTIILFSSAATVGATGHYGAQLIHIEGIGAAGKNLELGEHDHEH